MRFEGDQEEDDIDNRCGDISDGRLWRVRQWVVLLFDVELKRQTAEVSCRDLLAQSQCELNCASCENATTLGHQWTGKAGVRTWYRKANRPRRSVLYIPEAGCGVGIASLFPFKFRRGACNVCSEGPGFRRLALWRIGGWCSIPAAEVGLLRYLE